MMENHDLCVTQMCDPSVGSDQIGVKTEEINVAFASNPPLLLKDKFIRFAEETPISILAI